MPQNVEHLGQYESGISYKKVLFWFIMAAIVISLSTTYFALSKVIITLIPKIETKELELKIILDSTLKSNPYDLEKDSIYGVLLSEESKSAKEFKNLLPKKIEEQATGKVTIHNGYTRAQGFKEGEVLVSKSDPPQKIALKEKVIVYRTQTKTVEAYALDKGIAGHIPPTEFNFERYDDFMNEKVTATSEEAFSGGVRTAPFVTEEDLNLAKSSLLQEINEANEKKIKERLREGEEFNKNTLTNTILAFESSVTPPFETDNFSVKMSARTTAAVFKKKDLLSFVNEKLKEQTDDNYEFLENNTQDITFNLEEIIPENQSAILKVTVKGEFEPKLSPKIFDKDEIKGYNEKALRAHYLPFDDIDDIQVKFWPKFRKTVPETNNRIIIEVKNSVFE
jgi:hypothetical protein